MAESSVADQSGSRGGVQGQRIVTPSSSGAPVRLRFEFLNGLRGLAALYVVVFHLIGNAPWPDRWPEGVRASTAWLRHGYLAVDVLIILSGFLLMLGPAKNGGKLSGGMWEFFKRRAQRLLPPYFFAYAAYLLFWPVFASFLRLFTPHLDEDVVLQQTLPYSWDNILAHLFLLHPFKEEWITGASGMLWTVGVEWHCYCLFALLLLPVWRVAGIGGSVALAFLIGLAPVYFFPGFVYTLPWRIGLFGLGMAAAVIAFSPGSGWRRVYERMPWGTLFLVLSAGLVWLVSIRQSYYGVLLPADKWVIDAVWGLCVVSGLLYLTSLQAALHRKATDSAAAVGGGRQSLLIWLLSCRPVVFLSQFSYSLYLTHALVVLFLGRVLPLCGFDYVTCAVLMMLLGIPMSLAVGYLFYLAFERPFLPKGSAQQRSGEHVFPPVGSIFAAVAEKVRLSLGRLVPHRDYSIMAGATILLFLLLFKPWDGTGITPANQFSHGSGILWFGVVALLQTGGRLAQAAGVPGMEWVADSFSLPYRISVSLVSVACGFLTLTVIYRTLRMMFRRGPALLAALGAGFGSPLLGSIFSFSTTSYAPSALAGSLLIYVSLKYRKCRCVYAVALMGAVSLLVVLIRWQDAVLLALPASIWAGHLLRTGVTLNSHRLTLRILSGASVIAGLFALSAYYLELGPGAVLRGTPGIKAMEWGSPEIAKALFGGFDGLFYWHPLTAFAAAGLLLLCLGRKGRFPGSVVLTGVFALSVYVNAAMPAWSESGSFGGARFCAVLPVMAFGLAAMVQRLRGVFRPLALMAVAGAVTANVILLVAVQRQILGAYFLDDLHSLGFDFVEPVFALLITLPLGGYMGAVGILDGQVSTALLVALAGSTMIAILCRLVARGSATASALFPEPRRAVAGTFACAAGALMLFFAPEPLVIATSREKTSPLLWAQSVIESSRGLMGTTEERERAQTVARIAQPNAFQICVIQAEESRDKMMPGAEFRWMSLARLLNPFHGGATAAYATRARAAKDEDGAQRLVERREKYLRIRVRQFSQICKMDPVLARAHLVNSGLADLVEELATIDMQTSRPESALQLYQMVLAVFPDRPESRLRRTMAEVKLGRTPAPQELDWIRTLPLQSELAAESLLELAAFQTKVKDVHAAVHVLAQGLARCPADPRFPYTLNQTLNTLKPAAADLELFSTATSGSPHYWTSIGDQQLQKERFTQAEEDLKKAVASGGETGYEHFLLGKAVLKQNRPAEALQYLRVAYEKLPDFVPAVVMLAEAMDKLGDHQDAIVLLDEAIARHPANQQLETARKYFQSLHQN